MSSYAIEMQGTQPFIIGYYMRLTMLFYSLPLNKGKPVKHQIEGNAPLIIS